MPDSLRLVFDPTGDLLTAARECEAEVFAHWYGNSRAQLAAEYDSYESGSVFVAVADAGGDVHACARFLVGGECGLKTVDDVQRSPWNLDAARSAAAVRLDLASSWDVATIGVRPDFRQGRGVLALALYHGMITALRVNDVSAIVAILDLRVRRLLHSAGIDMRPMPGTRPHAYLGSAASAPVYALTLQTLENQRRRHPDAHRLVTMGVGLDGISVPSRGRFLLRRPSRQLVAAGFDTAGFDPAGFDPAGFDPAGFDGVLSGGSADLRPLVGQHLKAAAAG
jgi:N-acyl-L-homoserine lactone synthetase